MSKLGFILRDLIGRAAPLRPVSTRLPSGLRVAVRILGTGETQLSLTRTLTQKPSRKEAVVCAEHAGWAHTTIEESTTRGGLPCLLVTQVGA